MKIGILTFHCAHNYGAVLQAYCLQAYLKILGHEVSIIDYRPNYLIQAYDVFSLQNWFSKRIDKTIQKLFTEPFILLNRIKRHRAFDKFNQSHMSLISCSTDIKYLDAVILGSDQIWNSNINHGNFDDVYFGANLSCKKIAYAASSKFKSLNTKEKEYFRNKLKGIECISVREVSLAKLLQPLVNTRISVVLDPTLLVDYNMLNNIVKMPNDSNYILLYDITPNEGTQSLGRIISEKHHCKAIVISSRPTPIYKKDIISNASPSEFLGYIKNAKYIVTTSFHGMALSIKMGKNFYVIKQNNDSDLRIINLLEKLNLMERFVEDVNNVSITDIDYTKVNSLLDDEIISSKEYLIKSLES